MESFLGFVFNLLECELSHRDIILNHSLVDTMPLLQIRKTLDKEERYGTKIHVHKLLQVHTKLNELLRKNYTVHIDKGIIVTLSGKYTKAQDTLFKRNKARL